MDQKSPKTLAPFSALHLVWDAFNPCEIHFLSRFSCCLLRRSDFLARSVASSVEKSDVDACSVSRLERVGTRLELSSSRSVQHY